MEGSGRGHEGREKRRKGDETEGITSGNGRKEGIDEIFGYVTIM